MSNKKTNSNFIVQGSILAATTILVRIIGIIYRIPLTNILGDKGMAIYSVAYDVYNILLVISSLSLPLAVSKLVSARVAVGQMKNSFRIFLGALGFSSIVGVIVGVFAYTFSGILTQLWRCPESAVALKILAPTLVIMSVVGVFRGYFNGLGTLIPTAFSNIVEQIANAIISVVAAKILYDYGKMVQVANDTYNSSGAYGAAGGTLGTAIGALTALLFLFFVFYLYRNTIRKQVKRDKSNSVESYSYITKLLAITIIPVLLSTTIYNISGFLDSGVFNNIMDMKGIDKDVRLSLLGMFSGKYRLLLNVPIALAAAMSSSIIPSISASISMGKIGQVINKIDTSIRFSMIIAFPCAVGLAVLATPILVLLFPSSENFEIPTRMIQLGAISVVFYTISTISNSILQGINKMRIPVKHAFISLVIHFIVLTLLLALTNLDIYVVVLTDVLFALVITILNAVSLRKYLEYHQEMKKTFILPAISSVFMGMVSFGSYKLLMLLLGTFAGNLTSNAIATILSILISVLFYFALLLLFKVVDEEELYKLPKGTKFVKLAKMLYLLK